MQTNIYTALITPFKKNAIDEEAFAKIIESQIINHIDGIVPCGTTGESPTLSHQEHHKLIEIAVNVANKKIKVMAGTGSNSTSEAVELTNFAKKIGADSCLIVAPYYNKPSPDGIYEHFKELNKCDIPLIIYNIPARSVINISDQNIARIANLENVVGIKDATGDLARMASLRLLIKKDFMFLSGEDATAVGFNAMGGNGIISVSSNILPKLVGDLQRATADNRYKEALTIQDKLTDFHATMFCETNPIAVKYACSLLGYCTDEIRLPLIKPSIENKERIKQQLIRFNLI